MLLVRVRLLRLELVRGSCLAAASLDCHLSQWSQLASR